MQYSFHCPHCLSENVAFNYVTHVKKADTTGQKKKPHHSAIPPKSIYTTFWTCAKCHKGLCVTVKTPFSETPGKVRDTANYNFMIEETYPEVKDLKAPEHTPPRIANIYIQGMDSFKRGSFDAAGTMMRKAMDMTVDAFIPEHRTRVLYDKINLLKNADLIPKSMLDWADEVRIIGKYGAHDIPDHELLTEEEAQDAVYFTEMFLTYIYTLPGEIARRRASVQKD